MPLPARATCVIPFGSDRPWTAVIESTRDSNPRNQTFVSPAASYTLYTSSEGGIEWFTSRNIFFFFSTRRSCSLKILPPKQFRGSVFECGWRNKESCSRDSIDSKSVSVFLSRRSESNCVFPSATCCRNRERPLSRFPDNDWKIDKRKRIK